MTWVRWCAWTLILAGLRRVEGGAAARQNAAAADLAWRESRGLDAYTCRARGGGSP